MNRASTPAGLRVGDRIRLLQMPEYMTPLEGEALQVLQQAVGAVHPIDSIDESGQAWIAFEAEPDRWLSYMLYPHEYEKAD